MYYTTNEALKAASVAIWVWLGWEAERSQTKKINFVLPWLENLTITGLLLRTVR
jgi:hypothetical protein